MTGAILNQYMVEIKNDNYDHYQELRRACEGIFKKASKKFYFDSFEEKLDQFDLAFIQLWVSRDKYDPEQSFEAWFYTVSTNILKHMVRSAKTDKRNGITESLEGFNADGEEFERVQMADSHDGPEEETIKNAIRQMFWDKLQEILTARQQSILDLYINRTTSIAEIAKAVGLEEAQVSREKYKAIDKIKRCMDRDEEFMKVCLELKNS